MATGQVLTERPDENERKAILLEFFQAHTDTAEDLEAFDKYLEYYAGEIKDLRNGPEQNHQTNQLAVVTHQDVIGVVRILRKSARKTRPQVREELNRVLFPMADTSSLNRAIDVSLRLWLMVNTREEKFKLESSLGRPCLYWNDKHSLQKFLCRLIPKPRWELTAREGRYDPHFTAAFMTKVCGLNLRWTTSLEDHLRLDRRLNALWIFPYKSWLTSVLENPTCIGSGNEMLLSLDLLQETIDSLLLLFPSWDRDTQNLLKIHAQTFHEDTPFQPVRPLGILDFKIWRDRLLELYQEVYQVQTPGWLQLRRDRRNPQQYVAFCLALIIAILTFLSTILAMVSTAASIYQTWAGSPQVLCVCSHTSNSSLDDNSQLNR